MRVLQIMSGAEKGGAETFFVDLVGALHRAGLDQRVIIRRNTDRAGTLRAAGLVTKELPFHPLLGFKTRAALHREIEEYRPHIVQTWMSRASAVCPTGPFVHVGWFGGYYHMKYFRHCHELVAVTHDLIAHILKSGWPRERTHYLPTFAVQESMPPLKRADFDTPEHAPLILALGRLHAVKGFDVLLKALTEIPGAYLWLAGEGPLEHELKSLTKSLGLEGRVRFLGWRTDRAAMFAACDMCVMPSRDEPFGTVMIESWAFRKPIIAAAAKGPLALISQEGNGLLVPIDDVPALAAAIKRLISEPDLKQRLVDAAWRAYEADYTEAKIVKSYLAFYERLAGGASALSSAPAA